MVKVKVILAGIGILIIAYVLAFQSSGPWCDVFIALGFIFVAAGLNSKNKHSLITAIKNHKYTSILVYFCYGMLLGLLYELVGHNFWTYPRLLNHTALLYLLPMWAMFGIICHETYGIFDKMHTWKATILSSTILLILIEGSNLFTHSWTYAPWVNIPILFFGWIALIITFVHIPHWLNPKSTF